MNEVNTLVGKSLLGVTGISAGIIAELERVVINGRKHFDRPDQILAAVRNKIKELSPVIANHLADTVLSAWIYGYDSTAKRFPPWIWNEFQTASRSQPPNSPTFKLFGMFDHEPSLKLDIVENAAKRLLERNVLTRPQFDQASDEAKQQAFTIAGNLSDDTIGRFRDFLYQDIHETDTGLDDFRARVEAHFGTSPIAPGHLENVYRTNFLSSVRDGRETLRQNPIVKATFPYQQYIPIHDARTRHNHLLLGSLGLNGTGIYRSDDPFWDMFTPPWDYQCRCTVRLLTVEQAASAGVKEAQEWLRTGRAPIQPEWRYAQIPFQPDNDFVGGRGNVGVIVMSLEKAPIPDEPRKFSSTQFNLDSATARTILKMAARIPDFALAVDGREEEPHITIKYGLHDNSPEAVENAVADFPPVHVVLGSASIFEAEKYDVVKIDVESAELMALNRLISDAVEHTDTHANYQPHLTLAYVKPGLGAAIARDLNDANGLELQFDKFVFSAKDRTRTVIPLASLMRMDLTGHYRAPAGYTNDSPLTIDGKHYTGGMFIPGKEFHKATDEQKKIILEGKSPTPAPSTNDEKLLASLTKAHKLRLPSGHALDIIFDSRAKSQGYYVRHKDPDRVRTDDTARFADVRSAATRGMELLKEKKQSARATRPAAAQPAGAKSPKTTDQGNWHYDAANRSEIYSRGKKAKFRDNMAAIRMVKTLKLEDRPATKAEQAVISKFVGWGQFTEVFSKYRHPDWEKEQAELKSLLSDDEMKAAEEESKPSIYSTYGRARGALINSHYTHPDVVVANWEMARKLGFNGGRFLEPAVGSGYYIGLMPKDLAEKTHVTAVEKDPTSADVAKALYPAAAIHNTPLEDYTTPDNFYDIVSTNVPFADVRMTDKKYKSMKPTLHDYYFLRSIDTAKPGGLIMHLTSAGTMDKLDERVRARLDNECELVSAIRFPGDQHKENAGTSVVTDMLILRKKHPDIPAATAETPSDAEPKKPGFTGQTVDSLGRLYHWVDGKRVAAPRWDDRVTVPDPDGGEDIPVNRYFAEHPEQVLGTIDRTGSMYAGLSKNVTRTEDYDDMLQAAIDRLPENAIWNKPVKGKAKEPERIESDQKYDEGATVLKDGKLFKYSGGALTELTLNKPTTERIVGQLGIRDAARELIAAQGKGDGVEDARARLNALYDEYTAKHGPLHNKENKGSMKLDPDAQFILSLEHWNATKKESGKADIFTKNTIRSGARAESANSVIDATGIVLNETGMMDVDRIAQLLKKSRDEVEDELISEGLAFRDPAGDKFVQSALYLSGNVRQKLKDAKVAAAADPKYLGNVAALEKNQPEDIDQEDIGVKLGAPWVPASVIKEFAADMLGARPDQFNISHDPAVGWISDQIGTVAETRRNYDIWGVKNDNNEYAVGYMELLDAALTGRPLNIRSAFKDENGNHVLLKDQTDAAREKMEELKGRFKEWVWEDGSRANLLHRHYNDNHNNIVETHFDGSHQTFPGMVDTFEPRDIQKNAVWRITTTGKALLAHEVGTGKTATMVAAAMELRRLGLAKKPCIAVMKANIDQVTAEAQALYPGAKILSTSSSFDADKRKETLNRITTGDYDMIIMTHDHLEAMQLRPENVQKFMEEELQELMDAKVAAEQAQVESGNKKGSDRMIKEIEKQIQRTEQRIKESMDIDTKDNIFFEDTGIDTMMVDEAHNFKSLPCRTVKGQIKGVPTGQSQRATDMLAKTRWMLETHGGRGVVFATGTPISNTMAELYNMQRYLQLDELRKRGVDKFDAWADTYGDTTSRTEFKLDGTPKSTSRFNEFVNLPELRHLASEFMDVQRADNLINPDGTPVIKRPKRHDSVITSAENPSVVDFMDGIHQRAIAMKNRKGPPQKGDDNMLNVCNDAKMGSIDLRLVVPGAEDHPDSKLNQCVRKVLEIYHANPGKTQAIFSDLGVHDKSKKKKKKKADDDQSIDEIMDSLESKTGFSVFDDMKKKLIEAGIPESEIVNFSELTDSKREEAQNAMTRGDARIAFGSTKKLGTGVNIQRNLIGIHHLDIPYVPAYLEQRDGRGYRSGNSNSDIHIYKYVQQGSADNLFWQIVANKSNFINQYMLGKGNRTMSDLDTDTLTPEQMIAVSTGDTEMLERVGLEDEVKKLRRNANRHKQDKLRLEQTIAGADDHVKNLQTIRAQHQQDARHLEARPEFEMEIKGNNPTFHKERKTAEAALADVIAQVKKRREGRYNNNWSDSEEIGKYRGMPVHFRGNGMLELHGPSGLTYQSGDSLGSLEYQARAIAKRPQDYDVKIREFRQDVAKMAEAASKPFRYADTLAEKEARLAALKAAKEPTGVTLDPAVDAETVAQYEGKQHIEEFGEAGLSLKLEQAKKMGYRIAETGSFYTIYNNDGDIAGTIGIGPRRMSLDKVGHEHGAKGSGHGGQFVSKAETDQSSPKTIGAHQLRTNPGAIPTKPDATSGGVQTGTNDTPKDTSTELHPHTVALAASEGSTPAHIEARKHVATHFMINKARAYRHSSKKLEPLSPASVAGKIDGMDLTKPVVMGPPPEIPPPIEMIQWQAKGGFRGAFFSTPEHSPEDLGIHSEATAWTLPGTPVLPREPIIYDTRKAHFDKVSYLHSTAAPTVDTWSVKGESKPVSGGGKQWYVPVATHPELRIPEKNGPTQAGT